MLDKDPSADLDVHPSRSLGDLEVLTTSVIHYRPFHHANSYDAPSIAFEQQLNNASRLLFPVLFLDGPLL